MIEEDLDAALERRALDERTSKAALIRRFVREAVEPLPPLHEDPLWQLVGADPDAEPVADIDTFLYGPVEHE
jgi:hypothetical protein